MSNYIFNESSLYNGISQQNPELRLTNQVEDAINTKLSVASGAEKRPSAGLLYVEDDGFDINCKGHELEIDSENKFILVFNSGTKAHTAYSTKGTAHKILGDDFDVDVYLNAISGVTGTFNPDADLRLTTVLATTLITNKNVIVGMETAVGSALGTSKYLYFKNGVQQVERTVIVGGSQWDSAKQTNNDTKALVDDFMTWIGGIAGYTGTRVSDSVVKVVRDNQSAFAMSATDSYGDTTMEVGPVAGMEFEALPPVAVDNEIVKIIAEEVNESYYYLKYDAGSNSWSETVGPNTEVAFDAKTMPHKIEYLEDTSGAATGTPGAMYFLISRITWAQRTTGDSETSPDPSFVGRTINDIFFFKNRLGFVSTDSTICSAVDDLFNFWPVTVKEVLDDDPVDRSVSTTRNVELQYAEVFPDSMAIIGNNTQYSLHSDGKPFTNTNATMDVTTSYEVSQLVKPKAVGSSLYMVVPRDSYSAVREYSIIPDTLVTDAVDITGHVPRLIPESIKQISTDPSLGQVFLIDKEEYADKYTLWNYSFYWQGNEKAQSAWAKWDFWFRPMAMGIFGGNLFIVGTEVEDNNEKTILVQLRLETNTIELPGFANPEPLIDRLQLYPTEDVISSGGSEATLKVDQTLYDTVDFFEPADLVLVDRESGAYGTYTGKQELNGDYFLIFSLFISNKFNFYLTYNNNLVGKHQIGMNEPELTGLPIPFVGTNDLPATLPCSF